MNCGLVQFIVGEWNRQPPFCFITGLVAKKVKCTPCYCVCSEIKKKIAVRYFLFGGGGGKFIDIIVILELENDI